MEAVSLTDPTLPRKLRQAKRPSTARVIILLALLLIGGIALGYGWTSLSLSESEPPALALVGVAAGMPLTILASIVWSWTILRRDDIGIGYGAAATLLGAGAGVLLAASSGVPLVIGVALLALGLLFLVLGIRAAQSRSAQEKRDLETMRTGTVTTATVTDKGYDFFRESARILTTVTFRFVDLQRTERWVQRTMLIQQANPVVEGQETRLWYDARNPGDEKGIVVELARQFPVRS